MTKPVEEIYGVRNAKRAQSSLGGDNAEVTLKRWGDRIILQVEDYTGPKAVSLDLGQADYLAHQIGKLTYVRPEADNDG